MPESCSCTCSFRKLNGFQLAGSKSLLKKAKKFLKYETIMNKLRTKPSRAAKLRKKSAVERILAVNAARLNRLRQLVVSFFMYDFPSPFQVTTASFPLDAHCLHWPLS